MKKRKRKIPVINSTSTADVAFLLLVFFVFLTSVDTDFGIQVELPHKENIISNQRSSDRNILYIEITAGNEILCGNQHISLQGLKNRVSNFIVNADNESTKPELFEVDIPFFGNKRITRDHIISIKTDGDSSYRTFFLVQNEVIKAYDELRDDIAWVKWQSKFATLTQAQQKAIEQIYPYKIAEVTH